MATSENYMISELIPRYRKAFLSHDPTRYARMLTSQEAKQRREKYHDVTGRITDALIGEQLAGRAAFAVPFEANGLTQVLPIDIDSGGLEAIHAVLSECHRRRLWAFGQYTPKEGVADELQHGYVFIPFDDLVNAQRPQLLGEEIISSLSRPDWKIESRAHGADTRLPLTRHMVNGTFGQLIFTYESIQIDPSPINALRRLLADYQLNSVELLPAAPEKKEPSSTYEKRGEGIDIEGFNASHDLEELLDHYGAKRIRRGLYTCPFHDDKNASLGVYARGDQKYCHCFSKFSNCPLSATGRNDAFNIYCLGEQLTAEEALKKINGRDDDKGGTSGPASQEGPGGPKEAPPISSPLTTRSGGENKSQKARGPQTDAVSTWFRDPELRDFIKAFGSSGVVIVHKVREKLGEQATNRAVNAEIERRRGMPYSERHLRMLNSERRELIAQWQAEKEQQEAEIPTTETGDFQPPRMQYIVQEIASRGGGVPSETAAAGQLDQIATSEQNDEQEGASYTPPCGRRAGLPKPPNLKAIEVRSRRVERWRSMDITQLEREFAIMKFTVRKCTNAKQRFALECMVKELEHEVARARGRGLDAMYRQAEGERQPILQQPPLQAYLFRL